MGNSTADSEIHAPVEIGFSVVIYPGEEDRGRDEFISKLELDPGDGSGWMDVLSEFVNDPFANQIPHTYTEPGTYEYCARATYWDGEIITTNKHAIVVLPAES